VILTNKNNGMNKKTEHIETSASTENGTPVNLGWAKQERKEIANLLNQLLANYSVHYQKLRNYHWNVKGNDFFDLHDEFEKQYNEARKHIDKIAEQIRVFSKTPYSTMKEYREQSEIKETGTNLTSIEMVKEILKDFKVLLNHMIEVVKIAIENGDSGTEEMVKGFVKKVERHHWMLSAFASDE
jgi:starvation-inducible DNA-binding protein